MRRTSIQHRASYVEHPASSDRQGWLCRPNGILRGFTLFETLVAALVLGAGLAVVMGCISRELSAISDGRNYRNAVRLAQRQLDLIAADAAAFGRNDAGNGTGEFDGLNWELKWSQPRRGGIANVVCTVAWQRAGSTRKLQLTQDLVKARAQQ